MLILKCCLYVNVKEETTQLGVRTEGADGMALTHSPLNAHAHVGRAVVSLVPVKSTLKLPRHNIRDKLPVLSIEPVFTES